jgi:hypothetical protein
VGRQVVHGHVAEEIAGGWVVEVSGHDGYLGQA